MGEAASSVSLLVAEGSTLAAGASSAVRVAGAVTKEYQCAGAKVEQADSGYSCCW